MLPRAAPVGCRGEGRVGHPYFALRDRGRVRPVNQDNALATEFPGGRVLLLVADGVGGARAGEVASAEAMNAALDTVRSSIDRVAAEEALARAVDAANARVYSLSANDAALSGMATTMVIALIEHGRATILNVGDSRAYVASKGTLHALTTDDSWVEQQVASGAMTRDEAERSPYRNAITKGIGVDETVDPGTIVRTALVPGDVLLLCSDGLYRLVPPGVIADTLAAYGPDEAGHRLVALANEGGGTDNISMAIFRRE